MNTIEDRDKKQFLKEYFLSVNNTMEPLVVSGPEAAAALLTRLLLLEPGTYPSHPDMGVGLVSRFRYTFESDISLLKDEIVRQIDLYLPQFTDIPIDVRAHNQICYIMATIDKYVYTVTLDTEGNTEMIFLPLSEIMNS